MNELESGRLSVGSSDGSVLESVELEVGVSEIGGDLRSKKKSQQRAR